MRTPLYISVFDEPERETVPVSALSTWGLCTLFLGLGASFGRSFFYIGVPPAHLFVGEIILGTFIIFRANRSLGAWARMLMGRTEYSFFSWCLLISLLYGGFEVLYGLSREYSPVYALENFAFNVYPLYLFLGIWMGAKYPTLLKKIFRGLAWILAFYGPAYFLFLDKISWTMPGSSTPVFSQAGGGGMIILSLLAFESKPRRFWPLMVIAGMTMLAVQVRAEWLSMAVAFVVWGYLERKLRSVALVAAIVSVLLIAGYVADVNIPSPAERGGSISSREIVARGLSAISPDLAREYTDSSNVSFYYGTVYWRTRWWNAIWDSVNEDRASILIGKGYGFPLASLVPDSVSADTRSPHNIGLYALSYSGWIGLAIFLMFQSSLMILGWKVYKNTGQAWALAFWISGLINAFFGNSFESPVGAIPFYLFLGLAFGPALGWSHASDRSLYEDEAFAGTRRSARSSRQPAFVQSFRGMTNPSVGEL